MWSPNTAGNALVGIMLPPAKAMNMMIMLFNKGAERIYGYRAADVIGKRNVSCLYPEGVAQEVMRRQEVTPVDVFATPLWLILTALAFGTLVAVTAGAMPAARAARVDPVRALRSE